MDIGGDRPGEDDSFSAPSAATPPPSSPPPAKKPSRFFASRWIGVRDPNAPAQPLALQSEWDPEPWSPAAFGTFEPEQSAVALQSPPVEAEAPIAAVTPAAPEAETTGEIDWLGLAAQADEPTALLEEPEDASFWDLRPQEVEDLPLLFAFEEEAPDTTLVASAEVAEPQAAAPSAAHPLAPAEAEDEGGEINWAALLAGIEAPATTDDFDLVAEAAAPVAEPVAPADFTSLLGGDETAVVEEVLPLEDLALIDFLAGDDESGIAAPALPTPEAEPDYSSELISLDERLELPAVEQVIIIPEEAPAPAAPEAPVEEQPAALEPAALEPAAETPVAEPTPEPLAPAASVPSEPAAEVPAEPAAKPEIWEEILAAAEEGERIALETEERERAEAAAAAAGAVQDWVTGADDYSSEAFPVVDEALERAAREAEEAAARALRAEDEFNFEIVTPEEAAPSAAQPPAIREPKPLVEAPWAAFLAGDDSEEAIEELLSTAPEEIAAAPLEELAASLETIPQPLLPEEEAAATVEAFLESLDSGEIPVQPAEAVAETPLEVDEELEAIIASLSTIEPAEAPAPVAEEEPADALASFFESLGEVETPVAHVAPSVPAEPVPVAPAPPPSLVPEIEWAEALAASHEVVTVAESEAAAAALIPPTPPTTALPLLDLGGDSWEPEWAPEPVPYVMQIEQPEEAPQPISTTLPSEAEIKAEEAVQAAPPPAPEPPASIPWTAEDEGLLVAPPHPLGEDEEAARIARNRVMRREIIETLILALIVFLSVKAVFQNFKVDGNSMNPTLENNEYLIVNKLLYAEINIDNVGKLLPFLGGGDDPTINVFHGPERGDVIVLKDPRRQDVDLIKRVIGLPGDTVEIVQGRVYINDRLLEEPYITKRWNDNKAKVLVPAGEYFVMGDNRDNSLDSRSAQVGFIPRDLIIGKAFLNYWPTSKFGFFSSQRPYINENQGVPRQVAMATETTR